MTLKHLCKVPQNSRKCVPRSSSHLQLSIKLLHSVLHSHIAREENQGFKSRFKQLLEHVNYKASSDCAGRGAACKSVRRALTGPWCGARSSTAHTYSCSRITAHTYGCCSSTARTYGCSRPALPSSALRPVPGQGSGTAEHLCARTPGRSVPRSARASQQQSLLPRPLPPRRYPGREGAVPDTARPGLHPGR